MKLVSTIGGAIIVGTLLVLSSCGGGGPSDQPDGMFHAVAKAMQDGEAQLVWQALPESYQKDVSGLLSEFSQKMDADVWNKSFAVGKKALKVLDEKQDMILAHSMVGTMLPDTGDEFKENLSTLTKGLMAILDSDIKTLEGVGSLDVEQFLEDRGTTFFLSLKEMAKNAPDPEVATFLDGKIETKVTNLTDTTATVEVTVTGKEPETVEVTVTGKEPETIEVVKVDGVWIPKEMADDWAGMIQDAKANIAEIVIEPADKAEFMGMAAGVESLLDQMLAADDQVEFAKVLDQAMQMFGGRMEDR